MTSWINLSGNWVLGLALLIGGIILVIVAIKDLVLNLAPNQKKWGAAAGGLAIGFLGGLLMVWGATGVFTFFKNKGNEIPHA